jgi:3-methylcrotonyl-CoA carboxylase alpha subunit
MPASATNDEDAMIRKLLVANRGEIACRIFRTARALGLRTVAVHSDADIGAKHVREADEAVRIGPAEARASYLDIDAILAAARASGADAIHPGYGFLSERASFAEACARAEIIFIGPPASSIRAMGDKAAAKALMEKAGVPVVPGHHGEAQDTATLSRAATRIGYPVLLKASAGGGGKGMRIVRDERELAEAIEGARREAKSSFGDDRLIVERYLEKPRHIEIQVFADSQGNTVHLWERDCSLQRRHQKVLEEAPAPSLSDSTRAAMGDAAVRAAKAVGYVGAGTVEFIMDPSGRFFFMEMNTRLQVEHPVTEMITGLDLVAWQIHVANGGELPLTQAEIGGRGHAIEVRLYAEDPRRDFLPATGVLTALQFPIGDATTRIDSGVAAGDAISVHYDPMIAKIVVHGDDRAAALARLRRALGATHVLGLTTNLEFLRRVAAEPNFNAGAIDTGYIARHQATLIPPEAELPEEVLAIAALDRLVSYGEESCRAAGHSTDPWSPWHEASFWRLGGNAEHVLEFQRDAVKHRIVMRIASGVATLLLPSGQVLASARRADGALVARIGGRQVTAFVGMSHGVLTIDCEDRIHRLVPIDPLAAAERAAHRDDRLTAPMPGRIVALRAAAGARVARGAALVVLEAMKMEHTIRAPADGVVERFRVGIGDLVDEGVELVAFKPEN